MDFFKFNQQTFHQQLFKAKGLMHAKEAWHLASRPTRLLDLVITPGSLVMPQVLLHVT